MLGNMRESMNGNILLIYTYIQILIVYGLRVVIGFRDLWGVTGLNACYEAEALD